MDAGATKKSSVLVQVKSTDSARIKWILYTLQQSMYRF